MRFKGLNIGFFILILAIATLAFFEVLSPYFSPILWAAILAVIFHPLKTYLRTRMGERNGLAALLTLLCICLIVFTPLAIIASSLVVETNAVYHKLQTNSAQFPVVFADLLQHLPRWAKHFLAENNLDNATQIQEKLSSFALKGGQYVAGSAFIIGKGTFSFTVGFGVMLYLLFFLLKDGSYLVHLILEALPLSTYVKHHLLVKFAAVARATVKGTVVVGVVQGILGGLAFWFTGIDGSLLWGALMAFLSLIPAVGSAIIWVPAAVFFFATGALWKGLFLVGFFVVIVGLVDNILRPLLVGKDTKMPDYLILIATLGGMEIYGINGFVIGPVIAALFIACWNLLSGRDNRENIEEIDEEVIEEGKKQSDTAAEAAAEAAAAAEDAAAEAEIKVSALAAAEAEKTASASKK
ncbi:MAG: AI-2E family transporter [Pantoea sp.]|uniref:Membrane protein n=1 Tax=Pantoea brenneri TaxID=472694 RepID=A0AAX3J7R6_9GAMM|nr:MULTISPECIES: AI-2E family transporter [Pantoea]MBS6032526.1 AI-2E family transporter [Pantoea sp.]MDH2123168.1 AI-2E family transporter [Pantoea brenneri]VXC09405.1 Membrane protein [Pantoea brenneri]